MPYDPQFRRQTPPTAYVKQEDVDQIFARLAVIERVLEALIMDVETIGQVLFEEPLQEAVDEALLTEEEQDAMRQALGLEKAEDARIEALSEEEFTDHFETAEEEHARVMAEYDVETPEEEAARLRLEAVHLFEQENEDMEQAGVTDINDVVDVPEEGRDV